jgi:metallo-beta-lactamase class B
MAQHLKRLMAGAALLSLVGLAPALAQDGAATLADLKQHVAAAHQAAGKDFGWAADMLCLNAVYGGDVIGEFYAGKRMSDPDEDFEPVQVFDGVYYVGLREIGAYAIKTSAGVVLIDTLLPGQTESLLIPHLKKVGIDPSQIKYVIVTHGHADHFGGAKYIQDHFKAAKIALTAPDWDLLAKLPQTGDDAPPRRDQVVADGDKITVGDRTFTIVFIPGHTPGAVSVLMAVKDHGVPHMAMVLGGAGWGLAAMPMPMRPVYAKSLEHMQAVAEANHVDVALENHPFLSNSLLRMAQLRGRKEGAPNPLVIGEDGYRRYITVFKECHAASTDRYKMLADKYGADPKAWPAQFAP